MQQADVGVVDEFVFLAFAEGFDGEAELVLDLVDGVVVQVGDAGVDLQYGLRDMQFVLPGGQL